MQFEIKTKKLPKKRQPKEPVVEPTYAQKRAAEYPDYRDYLDGIAKNDQAQIQDYVNKCLAVKTKYPKE